MRRTLTLIAGALLAAPLAAQQAAVDSAAIRARQRIEAILGIPRRAEEIRRTGVPDSTVRGVLDILVKQRVPAEEAVVILDAERDAAAEHGPTDNFGAFVQAQLAAGKRGRELAAAIRAEHQARGKGKPNRPRGDERDDEDDDRGRPEARDRGGRPGDAAKGGRPDDAAARARKAAPDTAGKRPGANRPPKRPH